ncbi:hypothetical protein AB990_11310 [Alkalihalobacillus pseudalcaliphilus]|nr:hypothetical protein AB990_11310 [Alkalihalobacillus pseudalcaliphilus]
MDNHHFLNQQILKGMFDLAVLTLVDNKPMYGYELTNELRRSEIFSIADGSIYPILKRLTTKKWVYSYQESYDGRIRKYYAATPLGSEISKNGVQELEDIFSFFKSIRGDVHER